MRAIACWLAVLLLMPPAAASSAPAAFWAPLFQLGGSSTIFREDSAHTSGHYGAQCLAVRKDSAASLADTDLDYAPLQLDATGLLRTAATQAGAWNVGNITGTISLPTGAATDRTTAAGPFSVRLSTGAAFYDAPTGAQFPAALVGGRLDVNVGNTPTITAADLDIRNLASGQDSVAAVQSGTWAVTANAGTNLNTSALLTTSAHDAALGTAGSADAQVRTIQGIASMTPVQVSQATAANLNATVTDGSGALTVDGTVASTQSGTWNVNNISGTVSLPTGAATAANQATSNTHLSTLAGAVSAARVQADVVTAPDNAIGSTVALSALNAAASVSLRGMHGVTCVVLTGTLTGTVVVESSQDGGSTYPGALFFTDSGSGDKVLSLALTNPNAQRRLHPAMGGGTTHIRVRVSAYTSGTADAFCVANRAMDAFALALNVGINGAAAAPYAGMVGHYAEADAAALDSSLVAEGDVVRGKADFEGRQFVRTDHPRRVMCRLTTTATTSTLITGCSAPGAGVSIWITDVSIMGGVATGATAAASIQYGTGGTCGTGTTVVYDCQHSDTSGCSHTFRTPIKVAANSEVCILDATVGTKWVTITGHIAP